MNNLLNKKSTPSVRHGLIGCGKIASLYDEATWNGISTPLSYLSAISLSQVGQAIAICDQDPVRLKQCSEKRKIQNTFTDPEKLITSAKIDVLWLCIPPPGRKKILLKALEHGIKNIVCEKPIAESIEEAKEISRAIQSHQAKVHIPFLRRFHPGITKIAEDFQSGKLGKLQSILVYYTKDLNTAGPHVFDLLLQILGPTLFSQLELTLSEKQSVPTTCFRLPLDHLNAQITCIGLDHHAYSLFEVDAHFEKDRIQVLDDGSILTHGIQTHADYPDFKTLNTSKKIPVSSIDPLRAFVTNVEEVCLGQCKPISTFENGLIGMQYLAKAL